MKKYICAAVATFCIFWIIGLAGSFELDRISTVAFIAQAIPMLVIFLISGKIGGFIR